jgi:hypothetical protein
MAFSNTYDQTNTGSAVSNREQLLDVLTILAPEETPLLSLAKKSKATSTYVEWTVDSLAAPSSAGISEGADVDAFADKFAARARLGNYVQKFRRPFMVSDLQQAVDSVGPAKVAQAESKALRELKRDIEKTICSENDRNAEDGAGQAYTLRGFGKWVSTAPGSDVPSQYRTSGDAIHESGDGTFDEDALNDIITEIYRKNGMSNMLTLLADTALRREISKFTRSEGSTTATSYQVQESATSKKITFTVSMYESDQGIISIINMNPDCAPDTTNKDTGYIVNPSYVGVAELIPVGSTLLENQGGGERGFVDATCTLLVNHPQAHGKITTLS